MKKIFTLFASALVAMTASAGDLLYFENGSLESQDINGDGGSDNVLVYENGCKLILNKADKSFSKGEPLVINGESLRTIKGSNGALCTLNAPEGKQIVDLVIYSYINYDRIGKGSEGRVTFWAQLGDKTFTADDATILKDYIDDQKSNPEQREHFQNNPDVTTLKDINVNTFDFKNSGEQVCFILDVTLGAGSGIADIIASEENVNAPMYNMLGVQVDSSYKGLVIKNGKKFINK